MEKLIFSLSIIIVGIICGQFIKRTTSNKSNITLVSKRMDQIRVFAFLILNPIVMINSYWIIDFNNISMLILPFICLIVLFVGGAVALFISNVLKHNSQEKASMFACGTFSNLGTIGGLITLTFLGEKAFTIAALYFLFESFYNFLIAYPIIKYIGEGKSDSNDKWWLVFYDKTIIIYIISIIVGVSLNLIGLQRPQIMTDYNNIMIPVISFLLTFAISYKMEFRKIKSNLSEGIIGIIIKVIVSPIVAILVAYLFGLQNIENGLVIKVLLIMSTVPCGFNSILVPTIYKADKDVANSIWIMTMIASLMVLPIIYYIVI